MRNTLAIAHKELRSYFASPIGYIVLGFFALLYGWFYVTMLNYFVRQSMQVAQFGGQETMNVNQVMLRPLLQNVTILLLFLMPMVTMRSYAEEKRSGTIELLLTSPLKDWEIILGKFLGALGLYVVMLAVTLVYMAILFIYGNPEWKPLLAAYLGLLLMGGAFIALGLMISSTTNNQIVAGVISFVVFLLLWIVGWFGKSLTCRTWDCSRWPARCSRRSSTKVSSGHLATRSEVFRRSTGVVCIQDSRNWSTRTQMIPR